MAILTAATLAPNGSFAVANAEDIKITSGAYEGKTVSEALAMIQTSGGGIVSFVKTSSSGEDPVVDTYTMTFSDGSTATIDVTNGKKGDKGDKGDAGDPCHASIEETTDQDGTKHAYLKVWDGNDDTSATRSGDLMVHVNEVLAAIDEIMGSYSSQTV